MIYRRQAGSFSQQGDMFLNVLLVAMVLFFSVAMGVAGLRAIVRHSEPTSQTITSAQQELLRCSTDRTFDSKGHLQVIQHPMTRIEAEAQMNLAQRALDAAVLHGGNPLTMQAWVQTGLLAIEIVKMCYRKTP